MNKTQNLKNINEVFANLVPENSKEKAGLKNIFKSIAPLAKCVEKNCSGHQPGSKEIENCLKKKCKSSLKNWELENKEYLDHLKKKLIKQKFNSPPKTLTKKSLNKNVGKIVDAIFPTQETDKKKDIQKFAKIVKKLEKIGRPLQKCRMKHCGQYNQFSKESRLCTKRNCKKEMAKVKILIEAEEKKEKKTKKTKKQKKTKKN